MTEYNPDEDDLLDNLSELEEDEEADGDDGSEPSDPWNSPTNDLISKFYDKMREQNDP